MYFSLVCDSVTPERCLLSVKIARYQTAMQRIQWKHCDILSLLFHEKYSMSARPLHLDYEASLPSSARTRRIM